MKPLYTIMTLLVLLGSASALECYEPFKNINNTCCEDHNNNTVCDYNDMQKLPVYDDTIFMTTTSTTIKPRTAEDMIALEKDPSSATTLPTIETTVTTTLISEPSTTIIATTSTVVETPTTNAPAAISPTTTQSPSRPTITNTKPMPTTTSPPKPTNLKSSNSYTIIAVILFVVTVVAIVLYKLGSDDD